MFAPGTNWDYSHTNYVILGQALEKITGQPLDVALQEQVLAPLGLRNTVAWSTPEISEPVLHAFSSERRQALGIPAGTRFYEESTYWNPSWSLAPGSIQTTDIVDMTTTRGRHRRGDAAVAGVPPGAGRPRPPRLRRAPGGLPDLPHPQRDATITGSASSSAAPGSCRTRSSPATAR